MLCFFKQKTAYEMRISDWSSDVCSSDLLAEMKSLFDRAARDNHVYPIGAGLIPLLYPDQRIGTTATEWTFTDLTRRLPEFAAPDLRARHSRDRKSVV